MMVYIFEKKIFFIQVDRDGFVKLEGFFVIFPFRTLPEIFF